MNFVWDDDDLAIWYKEPIIHTFNKDESIIPRERLHICTKVKDRKNIILLWDSMWDINMVDWFEYNNLLKIWFLNDNEDELLEKYKEKYDIIITWDWDFNEINKILKTIK